MGQPQRPKGRGQKNHHVASQVFLASLHGQDSELDGVDQLLLIRFRSVLRLVLLEAQHRLENEIHSLISGPTRFPSFR